MHRDLKPQNILLTKECEPKIGDLGSARLTDVETSKTQTSFTVLYMAPELAWGEEYGKEVDVFSFGIALWEIVTGAKAFADLLATARGSGMVVSRKIYEGARPKLDATIPKPARDLMEKCWMKEAKSRPTFARIFDDLSKMRYQLLPVVDPRTVEQYVAPILAFEQAYPPRDLGQDD
jgi:serine/threonine protein kinase